MTPASAVTARSPSDGMTEMATTPIVGWVYFFAEGDRFKIGWSVAPATVRMKIVAPTCDRKRAWAIGFRRRQEAKDAERLLHRRFSRHRLPDTGEYGGTEWFASAAWNEVKSFVEDGKVHLRYAFVARDLESIVSAEVQQVMVSLMAPAEVRVALKSIAATTNRTLRQVMMEAVNDLAVKYGHPPPCHDE